MFFVSPSDTDTWFNFISLMHCIFLILMECSYSRTSLFLCRMGILLCRHPTWAARSPSHMQTNQALWHPELAIKAWPPQPPVCKPTLGRRAPAPGEGQPAGTMCEKAGNFCWNLPGCCLPVPWCQASLITMELFPYLTLLLELVRKSKCNTLWAVACDQCLFLAIPPHSSLRLCAKLYICLGLPFSPKMQKVSFAHHATGEKDGNS